MAIPSAALVRSILKNFFGWREVIDESQKEKKACVDMICGCQLGEEPNIACGGCLHFLRGWLRLEKL
jgi:hypothetical protein